MLAGLRDGRTLRTLYVSHAQFKTYCDAHPEYAREARPLKVANAEAARRRKGERLRSKTHCKHGHSLVDARIYFCKGYIKRDCRTCWKIRSKRGGATTPEVLGKLRPPWSMGLRSEALPGPGAQHTLSCIRPFPATGAKTPSSTASSVRLPRTITEKDGSSASSGFAMLWFEIKRMTTTNHRLDAEQSPAGYPRRYRSVNFRRNAGRLAPAG
jgi:hypothetical protein